ncbi:MAG TPA: delta-60 repeat domain-containing protein [Solirubrobacterales bacterium]
MKKLLLVLMTCSLAIAGASEATAKTVAGRLDPSFGKGGKATIAFPAQNAGNVGVKYELPFQFTAGHIEMAAAPDGKLIVAGSTKVARLLRSGKFDQSFGSGGSATIPQPPGMTFVLAGAAVDSQGRVLLAGSARPLPSSSTPDPLLSSAVVVRLNTDGSLDPSFASGGMLVTDFGTGAPTVPTGKYTGPAIGIRSIVVDPQGRPLLTGGFVAKASTCFPSSTISTAFVARLTDAGSLDSSFGEGGLRKITNLASFGQGSLTPAGTLFTVGSGNARCGEEGGGPAVVLTSLDANGVLDQGFGFSGFRSIGYPQPPVATVAPSGKIVLLGARRKQTQLVTRLLPNGAPDPSFGRTGRVSIQLPAATGLAAVAVDKRGRLLFAGRSSKRISKSPKNQLRRSSFVLARMNADGDFDRAFGRRGSVRTGFGGPANSFATEILIDARGRIVVGGGITTPRLGTGGGFAIARYFSGR